MLLMLMLEICWTWNVPITIGSVKKIGKCLDNGLTVHQRLYRFAVHLTQVGTVKPMHKDTCE